MNFQTNAVPMEIRARAAHKLLTFSKLPFDSVFWINSGAEANENAFKMAFKMRPGRTHVAAVEQSFHGRTAACASTTWQAPQKWFFLPRAPFDVSWIKRRDVADIANHVTENTAAVIVEPVQGVGGAFDMGQEFLAALRKRCDETGALLIFDEVQCGVGRTGQPFAANYYGVMPDMITTAKALGNGFPVSALLLTPPITASLKLENLGTTFGGGPMACAVAEATIDAIEKEDLLANVRRVSAYLTKTCAVGPVVGFQGAGFLAGLRMNKPAKDIQKALLRETSSRAPRVILRSCACCRPSSSRKSTSTGCGLRCWISHEQLPRSGGSSARAGRRAARARRTAGAEAGAAVRSPAKSSACCSSIRRCARWRPCRRRWRGWAETPS